MSRPSPHPPAAVPRAAHLEIDWDGRRVRIEHAWIPGPADAPLIVFLHEGLGCVAMWRAFPARLCAAARCRGLVYSRPVLAIQGCDDEYATLEQVRGIARRVPGTQVVELAKCGHSPQRDRPDRVIEAAARFMGRA